MSAGAFFEEGEISRLLRQDSGSASTSDTLESFRQSAAVLAAFNPETLHPVASGHPDPSGVASALIPELVRSSDADERDQFGWSLSLPARKDALRDLYSRTALQAALAANPVRPKSLLQQTFIQAVEGNVFDPAQMTGEALAALATVSDWLSVTELASRLPSSQSLRTELERRRDHLLLERLEGKYFTGREAEVARIGRHLTALDGRYLFVHGTGGSGKSALISHVLLGLERDPSPNGEPAVLWIRIDLDRSHISPENPATVLQEAAAQLQRRFPENSLVFEDFSRDVTRTGRRGKASLESIDSPMAQTERLARQFFETVRRLRKGSGSLVFWLDTFEEAQFLGEEIVAELLRLIEFLVQWDPALRIIISGRAPLSGSQLNSMVDSLALRDLPPKAAEELLVKLLERSASGQQWVGDSRLSRAVQELGGNPLTLHLAADLIGREGPRLLENPGNLKKEALQRWLYSRILQHLHNPDLEKLAVPGMVLRKMTAKVIRKVLAPHCGLGEIGPERAEELLDALSRELTLVEKNADGSLRHREDVRRLMIEGMPAELEPRIRAIDQAAVAFWAEYTEGEARAEELYHLLRLSVPTSLLDRRWLPSAIPFLRGALEEFSSDPAVHGWLAAKLKAGVSQMEMAQLGQKEWEELAYTEATRLVATGNIDIALSTLQQRSERLRGSSLFALESRTYLLLGRRSEALEVARKGIRVAGSDFARRSADLALLAAFILEGDERYTEALSYAVEGTRLARSVAYVPLRLLGKVRQLRLSRRLGLAVEAYAITSVRKFARRWGPNKLASTPDVLRELAAEVGEHDAEVLRWATNILLEELLLPMANTDLGAWLLGAGLSSDLDQRWIPTIDPIELQKMARSRVDEALHASNPDPGLLALLQELFRRKVDSTVFRQPGMASRFQISESPAELSPAISNAAGNSNEFRDALAGLISQLPDEALHHAARFFLRTDYARLAESKSRHEAALALTDLALQAGAQNLLLAGLETVALPLGLHQEVSALRAKFSM